MIRISCLLLAAGSSRRMGDANKLLLTIAGQSLVKKTAEEVSKFPFEETIAVTGYESNLVAQEIASEDVRVIKNALFETGMHSSIRAGLNALTEPFDGFMICLSDQPFFDVTVIEVLAKRFSQLSGPRIVYPVVKSEKGHPVIISRHFVPEILAEADGDHGCNYLFKRHPEALYPLDFDNDFVLLDVDTPEDYEKFSGVRP